LVKTTTLPRCFVSEGAHSTGLLILVNNNLLKSSIILNFLLKPHICILFTAFAYHSSVCEARILHAQAIWSSQNLNNYKLLQILGALTELQTLP